MAQNNDDRFANEVEKRLNILTGEDMHRLSNANHSPPAVSRQTDQTVENDRVSQFLNLKTIILSIEWEITDELLAELIEETKILQNTFSDNPPYISYFKLLGSVGKYIWKNKSEAHPDSIRLLHSIFKNFEKVFSSPVLSDKKIREILSGDIKNFKRLREILHTDSSEKYPIGKIQSDRTTYPKPVSEEKISTAAESTVTLLDLSANRSLLLKKIDRIEKFIHNEFEKLRNELRSLK